MQAVTEERATMKKRILGIGYIIASGLLFSVCAQYDDSNEITGPYLGQKPPGETPETFAPGLISHGYHEHCLTISPDGN